MTRHHDATRAVALLSVALLSATALVRVPIELYRGAALDFMSASRDLILALAAAGILAFLLLALAVVPLPARGRRWAAPALAGLSVYAWTRAGFFPGPSLNLDGTPVTADISTGWAGLLVPVAAAALLAGAGATRPRVAAAVLCVLLGGSLVQSLVAAASAWGTRAPAPHDAAAPLREWSRSGNVLVLILDSLQSDVFEDVLQAEPRLRDELDGFRHYRLASSGAPTTYLSLPTIHGGVPYATGTSVQEFYHDAVYEGSVLNRLASAGYRTSYAVDVGECPRGVAACAPTAALASSRIALVVGEASQLLDLGLYRVLPDGLRAAMLRRWQGPIAFLTGGAIAGRAVVEASALQWLASASRVIDSPPTAKMIHSMVTHPPAVLQPDCSAGELRFDRESVRLQAQCALRRVVALLERLRRDGVYDISSIVILADHGYGLASSYAGESADPSFPGMVGAFNPTVLVKPAGAHGLLSVSDASIELADVAPALCGDSGCTPDEGLRRLEAIGDGRTRVAIWYAWNPQYWTLPQIPGLVRYSIRGDLSRVESWSRAGGVYAPGTVIQFRRGANVADYAGFGWGERQKAQTWMVDTEATLALRGTFEPGRHHSLVLEAATRRASPDVPMQVTVRVNGVEVGRIVSVSPQRSVRTYRFAVPASVLSLSPDTVVRFSAERPPGADAGARPRLALMTLELRPAP